MLEHIRKIISSEENQELVQPIDEAEIKFCDLEPRARQNRKSQ
jgi:hypothetical protein